MSKQSEKAYGIGRLESKTARSAIIQKIATDFNLMPIIAEAYYKQISTHFDQHANIQLTSGQICYEAVAADEPAGRHIALTGKVSCRLTLNDVSADFEILVNYGLAGLGIKRWIQSQMLFVYHGRTECQVNRLKLIKRQMYGRADFDLLRKRVIGSPVIWDPG